MKIVLDANAFVSTVLKSHSKLAEVFQLAKEGKVILISSKDIFSEVKAVLLYPERTRSRRKSGSEDLELNPTRVISRGKRRFHGAKITLDH